MANLEQLLELNTKYQDSYRQLEKILLDILEAGEVTQSNLEDMQSKFEQETEYYNCLKQMQQTQNDMTLQEQIDELRDTKLDISVDSIIDLLTNGGRSSAISVGENGSIILDAASIEELNQVRFTVDEQNKRIESVIADTEVEQEDGTKVKLKVLFSTLDQKVDGVTTTVGQIEGIANDANSKAEGALTAASQIEQKVDRITTTVQGYETAINKGVVKVDNEFYISTSKESLVGGSWTSTTPTTISDGKYLWIRPVYTLKDGTKSQGTPVCTSGAKGDKGDKGDKGTDGTNGTNGKDGENGKDGKGIANITSYYQVNNSPTEAPTEWVANTPPEMTPEKRYLWSYTRTDFTDGSAYATNIRVMGVYGTQGLQGLQGPQGEQGIQGPAGTDGKNTYFHIKYSSYPRPQFSSQLSETPAEYIGTYVDNEPDDSTNPWDYTWARFQGLQGPQGEQGIPGVGTDGKTTYLHIKYSNDNGQTFTSNNGETVGTYIGTCTDFNIDDPTEVGSYTWAKIKGDQGPQGSQGEQGPQGEQGAQGETGNGIDHILTIYFVSTSKTTAPTFAEYGWVLDIPAYVEGNYLWSAYKIWYTDGTVGFTTPQYCSEWEANNKAEKAVSVATQTNDMFNWIVKKGSSSSSITLTDATISAIANSSIKLKASQITLEGLVTANNNFKILADGSIEAVNAKFTGDITGSTFSSKDGSFTVGADGRAEVDSLSVNGEFSTDVLTVNEINNSRYQPVLDEDVIIYIDPLGVASNEFTNYSTFTSIAQFLDMCPQNLNGHDVTLHFINNVSENIYFTKFHSGRIVFSLNSKILLGYMYVSGYGMQYEFSPNNNGKIMPNTAYLGDNGNYSVFAYNTSLRIQDVTIYAGNGSGNNSGIELSNFANGKIDNVSFVNCYNAVRAYVCSRAYITNTKGQASSFTFYSLSGSVLAFGSAPNASSKGGDGYRYAVGSNGQCLVEGADFSAGAVSGTNTNTSTGTTTKTVTITSDYGDTYRKTVYNSWKKDGTVRQGDYGYGDCVGCWFFGTKLSNYANRNVSKIVITFTRQSGGVSTAVTHGVRTHNYATRPSGSPSFNINFSKSVSVGVGGTGTITLTSSTDIKNFLAAKGIGLVPSSQTSSYYSVCSGTCKVKITYTA